QQECPTTGAPRRSRRGAHPIRLMAVQPLAGGRLFLLLRAQRPGAEALVELVHAAGRVHERLLAAVERVRDAADFQRDHMVLHPVEDLLGAVELGRGAEPLLPAAHIPEDHRAVLGMNLVLHSSRTSLAVFHLAWPAACFASAIMRSYSSSPSTCDLSISRFGIPSSTRYSRRLSRLVE